MEWNPRIMTEAEYRLYRQQVQVGLTGADIHMVNSWLGYMINSIGLLERYYAKDCKEGIDRWEKVFLEAKAKVDEYMINKGRELR